MRKARCQDRPGQVQLARVEEQNGLQLSQIRAQRSAKRFDDQLAKTTIIPCTPLSHKDHIGGGICSQLRFVANSNGRFIPNDELWQ